MRLRGESLLVFGMVFIVAALSQPLAAPAHFYSYGPGVGDSIAPVNDDGSTGELMISTPFPYFDQRHTSLYINTNGLISFLREVSQFTPDPFPLAENRRLVAAFWADVDTTRNDGRVYYREITTEKLLLQRATNDVRRAFVDFVSFTAAWLFVSTWHQVTYFGGSSTTSRNTFQIVLVTNGRHSFAIFNYGDILWTTGTASGGSATSGLDGTPAQAGFNAGDGLRYFNVPGSRQASIADVEQTTNVGLPGRWVFRIDDVSVVSGGCNVEGSLAVGPRFGPMLGGIPVVVSGPCFEDLSDLSNVVCKFDGVPSVAKVLDSTRARCILPMLLRTGRIAISLSVDGGRNYNYTGIFTLVAEVQEQQIGLLNNDAIDFKDFNTSLIIAWPTSYFNDADVSVDYVSFSYDSQEKIMKEEIVNLVNSTSNSGNLTLPLDIPWHSELTFNMVGAVRISAASEDGIGDISLWSKPHIAKWYINMRVMGEARHSLQSERGKRAIMLMPLIPLLARATLLSARVYVSSHVLCHAWASRQTTQPSTQGLSPCPCTKSQADVDNRFMLDKACSGGGWGCNVFHNGAQDCVRSASPGTRGGSMQCCYNSEGEILDDIESGGGTFDRSHTDGFKSEPDYKIPIISHFIDDVLPFFLCCKLSFNCNIYGDARPVDDCQDYEPPLQSRTGGDPHIITMDGLQYTFNGIGEYWLVRSQRFLMQGRATQMKNDQGQLLLATAWTSLALNASGSDVIQVQINDRTGFDVFVSGEKQDFEDLPAQQFNGVKVTYEVDSLKALIRFHSEEEYIIDIRAVDGVFYFALTWPTNAPPPKGLLGNANGNPEDDLETPDNVVLASDASTQEIHEQFGVKWMTTAEQSIFVYDTGYNHSSYFSSSFQPLFEVPHTAAMENITRVCNGKKQCVFDYHVTGKLSLALASADSITQYEVFTNKSTPVINCGRLGAPQNGSRSAGSPLVGSVITFSCGEGFLLIGSTTRQCLSTGKWSGEDTSCVAIICNYLEAPQNGNKEGSSVMYGSVVNFSCDEGFHLEGSQQRNCTASGTWSGTETTCVGLATNCSRLRTPRNGSSSTGSTLLGTVITFSCDQGFRLIGSTKRHCLPSGRWSGVETACVVIKCYYLKAPKNGDINESSLVYGSVVNFSCNEGFHLKGSSQRTCTESGTWSGTETTCVAEQSSWTVGMKWGVGAAILTAGLLTLSVCLAIALMKNRKPTFKIGQDVTAS